MSNHDNLANAIRFLSIDAVEKAKSGHPGMPMGMASVATVLFQKHMKFCAANSDWHSRDRFVLSAGHGSMLLYSLLYLTGDKEITLEQIKNFRQLGSKTAGHPEYDHVKAIETTTGPLGQGLATSVGIALSEKILNERFGDLYDHYTYVISGDGCLMEGISQEAISMAGHWKLNKLVLFWDDNSITIDGDVSVSSSEDMEGRFKSAGWAVLKADAHNCDSIDEAITSAKQQNKPVLIRCTSVIGFGSPNKSGTEGVHGAPLGADELELTRKNLGWNHAPFVIPDDILSTWRDIGSKGKKDYDDWCNKLANVTSDIKDKWNSYFNDSLNLQDLLVDFKTNVTDDSLATRKASQMFIDELALKIPNLIGGSADLTHSNLTKAKTMTSITPDDFSGNYVHYGIREHGMGSVINGLILSGGLKAYGSTFFVFSDFCRPSIRLAALMQIPAIYVLTHDSIGLGEDGPTHQPVEHLSSFRAMPNLLVFRPADVLETAECWELSISQKNRPSLLVLSRQNLPKIKDTNLQENNSAKGGYVVYGNEDSRDGTIMATGSEVSLATEVAKILEQKGLSIAVVSMPCFELFDEMDSQYKQKVLGSKPIFSIEAAASDSWYKYVGAHSDRVFSIDTFGVSAPAVDAYKHFGLTSDKISDAILQNLQ